MGSPSTLRQSVLRIAAALLVVVLASFALYFLWKPGLDVRDGRHDRQRNGMWLAHGWLGADEWFLRYQKTNEFSRYRHPDSIRALATRLRRHHITDVFPHLCPADPYGAIPAVDSVQVEKVLDELTGIRVIPWLGGPNGANVRLADARWRSRFVASVRSLLEAHPRLAGAQLNVEPLPSGDTNFLMLLTELRAALPPGKILSIAAYPPPTRWHEFPDVHWAEDYFRQVARQADQMAVMMYDVAQDLPKAYEQLMAAWTVEVLNWSEGKYVLLGVPTYRDEGVGWHNPNVENIQHALRGIHRGLARAGLATNYQGIAIYSDWETDEQEWKYLRENFCKF